MADTDQETRRIDTGRDSSESAQPVSKAAGSKAAQSLKPQDADWDLEPHKAGMAVETKMGMAIIVILVCAFGFLVYHKFDLKQRDLLNASIDNTAVGQSLKEAVESHTQSFSEFYPDKSKAEQVASAAESASGESTDELLFPATAMTSPNDFPVSDATASAAPIQQPPQFELSEPPVETLAVAEPEVQPAETVAIRETAPSEPPADPFAVLAARNAEQKLAAMETSPPPEFSQESPFFDEAEPVADTQVPDPEQPIPAFPTFGPRETIESETFGATASTTAVDSLPEAAELPPAFADFPDPISAVNSTAAPSDDEVSLPSFESAAVTSASQSNGLVPVEEQPESSAADETFLSQPTIAENSFGEPETSTPADSPFSIPGNAPAAFDEPQQTAGSGGQSAPTPITDDSTLIAMLDPDVNQFGSFPDSDGNASQPGVDFPEPAKSSPQVPNNQQAAEGNPLLRLPSPQTQQSQQTQQQTESKEPQFGVANFAYENRVQQVAGVSEDCEICEVRPNDNYWSISKRMYGTARYFSSLALYNQHRIADPKKLRPGMKVLIPHPQLLEQKYPELFKDFRRKETQPAGFFLQSDASPAYRVGERETLSEISLKHLGRASRWIQIYRMNQDILKDPNKLKPGIVLALPDDATEVHLAP